MPDEPDVSADATGDGDLSGDLTVRLKQLEERIATEPGGRRRRTPVRPVAPHAFPALDGDEPSEPAPTAVEAPAPEPAVDAPEPVQPAGEESPRLTPMRRTSRRAPATEPEPAEQRESSEAADPPARRAGRPASPPVKAPGAGGRRGAVPIAVPVAAPGARPAKTARRALKAASPVLP
ncbi:MAG: hypothetical protein JWO22_2569, partial [Frankiales bacterium]|nr:hypothetical protein [Frankiales bacterium]